MRTILDFSDALRALRAKVGTKSFAESTPFEQIGNLMQPLLDRVNDILSYDQKIPTSTERRKVPLWSDPDGSFTILATIWAPGQRTQIHDHEYWDVSGMMTGVLLETHYVADAADGSTVVPVTAEYHHTGAVWSVNPARPNIHTLCNPTRGVAISLNVHGTGRAKFERNSALVFELSREFLPGALAG